MTVERNEISHHEARAFAVLSKAKACMTSKQLAKAAEIAPRTARHFALKFCKLGLVDVAELFPSHQYILAEKAKARNASYLQRLTQACEIFGLSLS